MDNEIGLSKNKSLLERLYTDKWVVVYLNGTQRTYAGKFDRIEEEYLILQPHQGGRWKDGGKLEFDLIDNPEALFIGALLSIDITTQESIINYCKEQNKENK